MGPGTQLLGSGSGQLTLSDRGAYYVCTVCTLFTLRYVMLCAVQIVDAVVIFSSFAIDIVFLGGMTGEEGQKAVWAERVRVRVRIRVGVRVRRGTENRLGRKG